MDEEQLGPRLEAGCWETHLARLFRRVGVSAALREPREPGFGCQLARAIDAYSHLVDLMLLDLRGNTNGSRAAPSNGPSSSRVGSATTERDNGVVLIRCGRRLAATIIFVAAMGGHAMAQSSQPSAAATGGSPNDQDLGTQLPLESIATELRALREEASAREDREPAHEEASPIWSNWVLIAVSVCAVIAALKTLDQLRRQNELARRSTIAAIASARAAQAEARTATQALMSVEPASIHFQELKWVYNVKHVCIKWRNYGRTRATHAVFDYRLIAEGASESIYHSRTVIDPGETVAVPEMSAPIESGPTAIQGGSELLRLEGTIAYGDVFDRQVTLHFSGAWITGTEEVSWECYTTTHTVKRGQVSAWERRTRE